MSAEFTRHVYIDWYQWRLDAPCDSRHKCFMSSPSADFPAGNYLGQFSKNVG